MAFLAVDGQTPVALLMSHHRATTLLKSRKLPYRLATKFLTPFLVRLCRLILLLSSRTLLAVDLNTYSSESCSTGVKWSGDSDML